MLSKGAGVEEVHPIITAQAAALRGEFANRPSSGAGKPIIIASGPFIIASGPSRDAGKSIIIVGKPCSANCVMSLQDSSVMTLQLADYGSCHLRGGPSADAGLTPGVCSWWRAPELFCKELLVYGGEVDMWSVGDILARLYGSRHIIEECQRRRGSNARHVQADLRLRQRGG